ncbi:MAG: hypothetical protein OEL69_03655 [Nitrosopumilus sp.]|nr:hypothetical protein [Nitrosopumilus sp.]
MDSKLSFMFFAIIASITVMIFPSEILAQTQESENITITPINEEISLQKTVTIMIIPEDNKLPWGTVKGKASDYVERYPVIIQFFKGEEPVHFAQVDMKGDGSYEYKFRVRNVDSETGEAVNIFQGQYTVKIFKVIYNQSNTV